MSITRKYSRLPWMLGVLFFAASCSIADNTEQITGEENFEIVDESAISSSRSGSVPAASATIYRDKYTANNWRNYKINIYQPHPKWIIRHAEPRSFHYATVNGDQYWLNIIFYYHRQDVWYQIVNKTKNRLVQAGWSTVELRDVMPKVTTSYMKSHSLRSLFVRFDVEFDPSTYMGNGFMGLYSQDWLRGGINRGDIFWGPIPDDYTFTPRKSGSSLGIFAFHGTRVEGEPFQDRKEIHRSMVNPLSDWRHSIGRTVTDKGIYDWIFMKNKKIKFHYATVDDEKYWMNLTFFTHRQDAWYQIVGDKYGPVQSGWTTVNINQTDRLHNFGRPNAIFAFFDVAFDPSTHITKRYLALNYSKGNIPGTYRGEWTDTNDVRFKFYQRNPGLYIYGNFQLTEGHFQK